LIRKVYNPMNMDPRKMALYTRTFIFLWTNRNYQSSHRTQCNYTSTVHRTIYKNGDILSKHSLGPHRNAIRMGMGRVPASDFQQRSMKHSYFGPYIHFQKWYLEFRFYFSWIRIFHIRGNILARITKDRYHNHMTIHSMEVAIYLDLRR
jgi:hypothetical protein